MSRRRLKVVLLRPDESGDTDETHRAAVVLGLIHGSVDSLHVFKHRYGKPGRYIHAESLVVQQPSPIPMRLPCPECGELHIDEGEFATKPHHTHACQHCGNVWRPAVPPTVGVQFLPGFKNS